MTISRETLMRFVDGELSPEEASRVEAEIAESPEMRTFVHSQTVLRHDFSSAFAPIMDERIPDRLTRAIADTSVSWRWRAAQALSGIAARNAWIWTGVSAAGTLALGLVIGVFLNPANMGPIAAKGDGSVVAQGVLADALNTQLASDAQPAGTPRVGVSFHAKDGRDCRTFETGGISGIACRGETEWTIAALASVQTQAPGTYHMAGSAMPDVIRSAAAEMIDGVPFDAAAEHNARARGWRGK
ncbi:MAG TPA: hypothetical protein VL147_10000 [Devosia sp.]|nr:hypothetical protein [Devosia sp.]